MTVLNKQFSREVKGVNLVTCHNLHQTQTSTEGSVTLEKYTIATETGESCGNILLKYPPDNEFVYLSSIRITPEFQGENLATETLEQIVAETDTVIYIKSTAEEITHILAKYFQTENCVENWYRITDTRDGS